MSKEEKNGPATFWQIKAKKKKEIFHRTKEDIRRDLNIGPLEHLLLWFAKADLYVLAISTSHSRLQLVSLGMMVVFTMLLAFCSSLYTLLTTLIGPDTDFRWLFSVPLALVYTFGIVIIDREIVGATSMSKKSMATRFVFACFIAITVSYPVKLKFFEGRLNIEIDQMIKDEHNKSIERIEKIEKVAEKAKETQKNNIQQRVTSYNAEVAVLDQEIARESKVGFCGTKCQGYISQKEEKMKLLKETENELKELIGSSALAKADQAEILRLRKEMEDAKAVSYDILTKHEAFKRLEKKPDSDVTTMSYFLIFFFGMLELVPLVLKWSLGHTEYHYYIEARNNLNKQKIMSIANLHILQMQEDDANVFNHPREITNSIAALLEDESCLIEDTPEVFDNFKQYYEELQEKRKAKAPGPPKGPSSEPSQGVHKDVHTSPEDG